MTRMTTIAAALAGVSLSGCLGGCASLGQGQVASQALENLEYCERTYQLAIGALGAPGGSLFIRCPPRPFEPAVAAAGPALLGQ